MPIAELQKKKTPEMKRSALYMSQAMFDTIGAFATENGVSVNRAAVYLIEQGLNTLDEA